MHAARLSTSSRLQRVYALLSGPGEYSTLEIVERARVCAVNSIVAELRHAGAKIECRQVVTDGERRFFYRMTEEAPVKALSREGVR